jgi:hypothetical protein
MKGDNGSGDWTWQYGGEGWDQANAISVREWRVVIAGMTEGQLPNKNMVGQGDAFLIALDD